MQRAVRDVDAAAKSSAPASWAATRSASAGGAGAVFADREVERVGGDVILREIRGDAADAGGERRGERRMRQSRRR